ncbi:hypothetical protein ACI3ET_06685 [Ornithinimicrobium sp. LYQ121]|uniref:hypothetical protein n=1 Tax=Ornithinimicrobium sp. LYQ121 TaxID=3378801 RepID=UPI003852A2CF
MSSTIGWAEVSEALSTLEERIGTLEVRMTGIRQSADDFESQIRNVEKMLRANGVTIVVNGKVDTILVGRDGEAA